MSKMHGYRLAVFLLTATQLMSATAQAQAEWRFADVGRIVAVSDVHGDDAAFEAILQRTGIIDAGRQWSGGDAHLVVVGDVLDRGPDSRKAMDLIMALEPQALAAGGQVHLVLGNHEVMNLTGDLRYVSAGEYAAFAAEESADERAAAFATYRQGAGAAGDDASARAAFDKAYPPGYFAHRRAFSTDGKYGSWLLGHPLFLIIGNTAFVHGGLAGGIVSFGETLNDELHRELVAYLDESESLIATGTLTPMDAFYDRAARLQGDDAKKLTELQQADLFTPDAPIWYRGNVSCNRLTEQDRLTTVLSSLGATRLVVGHTPSREAQIQSRMNDLLLRVDTGMNHDFYGGRAAALVIENGRLSAMYQDETDPSAPVEQPRHVGVRPGNLTTDALEALLARATVADQRPVNATMKLVRLRDGDVDLDALFIQASAPDILPPVAAYRLDRLLRLDMVPVTVPRTIDGVAGSVQFWPPNSISEPDRAEGGLGGEAWCPLGDQISDMYRFDALIFNVGRTADRIRYSTEDFQLMLMGQEESFSTGRGKPPHLANVPIDLTPEWKSALNSLDEGMLTDALGDVLDRRRIRALLERRNTLLGSQ